MADYISTIPLCVPLFWYVLLPRQLPVQAEGSQSWSLARDLKPLAWGKLADDDVRRYGTCVPPISRAPTSIRCPCRKGLAKFQVNLRRSSPSIRLHMGEFSRSSHRAWNTEFDPRFSHWKSIANDERGGSKHRVMFCLGDRRERQGVDFSWRRS
ncbi:hypothetical protein BJ875DRAFT_152775 [Amylocarpus encephaloides]|uniref:Uncharacterized protein n=1 Tax=Amylocarpus encephaloides TaxID=45428 RepID=A0A9P7YQU6_9HELO|nr:hypothetical protein BJ875DRAFT_152775 [Amylocarpus encephaloides]